MLPPVPSIETIRERLRLIFPEGHENRNYVTRMSAVHTVFVMFYVGAVEGSERWIRPNQVTLMTDSQASKLADGDRLTWATESLKPQKVRPGDTWYAQNSREQIRDENIQKGLLPARAVIERPALAVTSTLPRYALEAAFAGLFDASLVGEALADAIADWQKTHISRNALARTALIRQMSIDIGDTVVVRLPPRGEERTLSYGPSSIITKAVIEDFARQFLAKPAVLWVSESKRKVVARDDELAKSLRLKIDPSKFLPDVILVDLGDSNGDGLLFVFVEVVASDGPIDTQRKEAYVKLAVEAGFDERHLAFVTAFKDKGDEEFRKCFARLARSTFAWCATEPECLIQIHDASSGVRSTNLRRLMDV